MSVKIFCGRYLTNSFYGARIIINLCLFLLFYCVLIFVYYEVTAVKQRTYIAIDLKSFYASVECVERGLDPMTTHLVVANAARTEKTICLAVTPPLKARGVKGRPRLFEVTQKVREINALRRQKAPGHRFTGKSCREDELRRSPALALDFITAVPHMARYIDYSAEIYKIYLKYIAPEHIHVYSIDEVFMDVTDYLYACRMTASELARAMILDVLRATGITAAAGIGTNLFLCKAAMDIRAKHIAADEYGVRIASLDEMSYRRLLWNHRPLTDFWRVGKGYARKLEEHGIFTMGDIARCSLGSPEDYHNEELLYRLFGVNAELLIDHAWGWEPCTMADIKACRPASSSICSGQVLHSPYTYDKALLAVKEMADALALELADRQLVTQHIYLRVSYDKENLSTPEKRSFYRGEIKQDPYGRLIPKSAHGIIHLQQPASSSLLITKAAAELFARIADPGLLVRRLSIAAEKVTDAAVQIADNAPLQPDLFTAAEEERRRERRQQELLRENRAQQAVLAIRRRFGKNAVLRGMSLQEGATAAERNNQIGGHRA